MFELGHAAKGKGRSSFRLKVFEKTRRNNFIVEKSYFKFENLLIDANVMRATSE
jgi:hypothetical protein